MAAEGGDCVSGSELGNQQGCTMYTPYILAYKSKNFGQIFALKVRGSTYMVVREKFFSAGQSVVHRASRPVHQHAHMPDGISLYTQPAGQHHLTSDGQSTPAGVKFHSLKCVTGISRRDNNHTAQLSSVQ